MIWQVVIPLLLYNSVCNKKLPDCFNFNESSWFIVAKFLKVFCFAEDKSIILKCWIYPIMRRHLNLKHEDSVYCANLQMNSNLDTYYELFNSLIIVNSEALIVIRIIVHIQKRDDPAWPMVVTWIDWPLEKTREWRPVKNFPAKKVPGAAGEMFEFCQFTFSGFFIAPAHNMIS